MVASSACFSCSSLAMRLSRPCFSSDAFCKNEETVQYPKWSVASYITQLTLAPFAFIASFFSFSLVYIRLNRIAIWPRSALIFSSLAAFSSNSLTCA
ncbi:hypothetical protein K450DRAFT_247677 [Umbelopsis ramanniana AG]|uniref:Uncharacterized protein n=1 Tax=Umbelopsis ramanniana AG TaxID=1314678 RepID=A0AAD5E785_UMBRA|nr:uncharacterized protein K450DRAFT_247677 [Umbelopsis ramanniana AG]KAI8578393.1 hypothetical protein K450DRAFT_247677 [Umbelopsis ramanniana AG]